MALENLYNDLTDEQKAKAKACTSPEELIALAKAEGIELSDEQLEGVAGGSWNCSQQGPCPLCRDETGPHWS